MADAPGGTAPVFSDPFAKGISLDIGPSPAELALRWLSQKTKASHPTLSNILGGVASAIHPSLLGSVPGEGVGSAMAGTLKDLTGEAMHNTITSISKSLQEAESPAEAGKLVNAVRSALEQALEVPVQATGSLMDPEGKVFPKALGQYLPALLDSLKRIGQPIIRHPGLSGIGITTESATGALGDYDYATGLGRLMSVPLAKYTAPGVSSVNRFVAESTPIHEFAGHATEAAEMRKSGGIKDPHEILTKAILYEPWAQALRQAVRMIDETPSLSAFAKSIIQHQQVYDAVRKGSVAPLDYAELGAFLHRGQRVLDPNAEVWQKIRLLAPPTPRPDLYYLSHPSEYLAGAVESFFLHPDFLQKTHPEIYKTVLQLMRGLGYSG